MWGYKNKSYLDKTSVRNGLGTLIVGKDGRDVIQTYYQPSNSYYAYVALSPNDQYEIALKYGTRNVTIVNNTDAQIFVAKTQQNYNDQEKMVIPAFSSYRVTFPINNQIYVVNENNDGINRDIYLEMEV